MEAKLQRRVQRYGWDKAADQYEQGWRHSLAQVQANLLKQADAQPGEVVIDIACGTGLVSIPLAQQVGPDGHVIATDISERMVQLLGDEAARQGLHNLEALRADAEDHHFIAENSVDLVTCALGLMYFPDTFRVMQEALRVLKPGGRAVFAVWGERGKCGWADIFPIVDARVQSQVCPLFFRLGTRDALAREMTRAGFAGIGEERLETLLPYPDEEEALIAAFAGGPVALAYNRFTEETRSEAHAEYLASIEGFLTDDGYRIPGEFVVCHGRKT